MKGGYLMAKIVQNYIKNLGKSVTYSASDVLSQKFDFVKEFKNENQEVFKAVYTSVKDYKTTFSRVKKSLTNNKVFDAARVGYDSVLYSIKSGDFYAKRKETEVMEKYGGNLMQDFDIDDDDFNWDNDDMSNGDKVIATAIKKNSKIGTALTIDAIAHTGKAQIDSAKENTMLLYTQNERMMNKLEHGFNGVIDFLKQNQESSVRVQNQMNDNLNKFMTSVDNNVTKLTKQFDELLEMQRNMYKPVTQDQKKRIGYSDIVSGNGIINIKEYMKQVKKQGFNEINALSGNMLSQVLGDGMGEGSNMLAQFAAAPFRYAMEAAVNKALGSKFDKAANQLNTTLEGIIPSLMGKLNAAGKKEDAGFAGLLGRIFGLKGSSSESINTSQYNRGSIPFDGITKRAITDVIPFYLRKMTSALTGGDELVYDYNTGKWKTMRDLKSDHSKLMKSANAGTEAMVIQLLESNMGGRKLSDSFSSKSTHDQFMNAVRSYASKLQSIGDFGSLRESDLSSAELEVHRAMRHVLRLGDSEGRDRRFVTTASGKRIESGFGRSSIGSINGKLRSLRESQIAGIKNVNSTDSLLRLIVAEGLDNVDIKEYSGKDRRMYGKYGDMNQRAIQELPTAQVILRAKDEYGSTLFDYLRDMGSSLKFIKANSLYLSELSIGGGSAEGGGTSDDTLKAKWDSIYNEAVSGVNYKNASHAEKYENEYYKARHSSAVEKEGRQFEENINRIRNRAAEKKRSVAFATGYDFRSSGDNVGLHRIMSDAEMDQLVKAELEFDRETSQKDRDRWKAIEEYLGKETANKMRAAEAKYDKDKSLSANMKNAKGQGFFANLHMFTKWAGDKVGKPGDVMADSILKVDYWLQNLIYGEDLKEDERKKSLVTRLKDSVNDGFKSLKDKLSEGLDWFKEKAKPILDPVKNFMKSIFGEAGADGINEGGLLSPLISGIQKGLRKNADDVKQYALEQARAAKNKLKESFGSNTTVADTVAEVVQPRISNAERRMQIDEGMNTRILNEENPIIRDQLMEMQQKRQAYKNRRDTNLAGNTGVYVSPDDRYANYVNGLLAERERLVQENSITTDRSVIAANRRRINQIKSQLKKVNASRTMAVGGINRGGTFRSVLSPGELHNGVPVTGMGIYTIRHGDSVVNPAPAHIRSRQAVAERNFLNNIRHNADANDGLTPEKQKVDPQTIQLLTNTDWNTLTTKEQKAEFVGNVVGRGLIGGGLGLLVGGPLLGASIGAASSLSKSTGAFANLIFGDAATKDGEVILNDDGTVKRSDNGLVTQEMMKALPEIKKFGLGGAIAGLLTPIGPLGGLLMGSALGFAKKSEIFEGTIFGEGGIFSDKNMNKLKKGAKNMGIGAAASALFLPGPFGLIGNALIGATAGYVTSTDKFKDAFLGERVDPNDPKSKRKGGIVGRIKDELRPLKGFGEHLRDNIMDEIFGKKDGSGKRQGGIFGAIKDNVVSPMIYGATSIMQSMQNGMSNIFHFAGDTLQRIRMSGAGNNFLGGVINFADNTSKKIIGLGGKAAKLATKPFRLLGEDGIGGAFAKRRINNGTERNLTARERLAFRGRHGMSEDTNDLAMAGMSREDLEYLMSALNYDEDAKSFSNDKANLYDAFGDELRLYLDRGLAKAIVATIKKDNDFTRAAKMINTANVSQEAKAACIKALNEFKKKLKRIEDNESRIKESGLSVQQMLTNKGINVDISNRKNKRYLSKQLERELAHKEVGLTDEEKEWNELHDFWTNKNSPLNPITSATNTIAMQLERIYMDLSYGREYDKMSDEQRAKFGSREEYVKSRRQTVADNTVRSLAGNSDYAMTTSKIGDFKYENVRKSKFLTNKFINNGLQLYTGNLKDFMSADDRLAYLKKDLDDMADRASQQFDAMVMEKLANADAIATDMQAAGEGADVLTREIILMVNDHKYEVVVSYKISDNQITPVLATDQEKKYTEEKLRFVETYIQSHTLMSGSSSYMGISSMIRNSLKLGLYLSPTRLPVMIRDALKLRPKDVMKAVGKGVRKVKFALSQALGSHDINDDTSIQRAAVIKYTRDAEKEWKKEVDAYQKAYVDENSDNRNDTLLFLDNISKTMYDEGTVSAVKFGLLSEDDQKAVHDRFISMYVKAKRDKQIFGRGLIGNISTVANRIKTRVNNGFKFLKNVHNTLFKADAVDAKNRYMDRKRKEAAKLWDVIVNDQSGKYYGKIIRPILSEYFGGVSIDKLNDDEVAKLKSIFIDVYADDMYNKLLYGGNTVFDDLRESVYNGTVSGVTWAFMKSGSVKKKIQNRMLKKKANKYVENMFKVRGQESLVNSRLDALASEMYDSEKYNDLNAAQQEEVNLAYYNKYYSKGAAENSVIGRMILNARSGFDTTMGTLKSGVKNSVAGRIDKVREWKEREQEKESNWGKFFDFWDARQMKKEKEKITGKKDSKLARILKWLFVGGVAAPIIVGFVKDKVMPAIHDKIQPWLKKLGEKVIGVKDKVTGEFKGGIVSGIVNPLKDKLGHLGEKIKEGFQSVVKGLKSAGEYAIEMWKSGASTIYGDWMPKIIEGFGRNFIPMVWTGGKAFIKGLGDFLFSKGKKLNIDSEAVSGGNVSISTKGKSFAFESFGEKYTASVPSTSYNASFNFGNVSKSVNANGSITYTNDKTGESITTENRSNMDFYRSGTDASGKPIYTSKSTNRTYYKGDNNQYIPVSDYAKFSNPEYAQAFDDVSGVAMGNGWADNSAGLRVAGGFARGMVHNASMKIALDGAKIATKQPGALAKFGSKVVSKIPFIGRGVKVTKFASKGVNGIVDAGGSIIKKPLEGAYGKIAEVYNRNVYTKAATRKLEKEAAKGFLHTADDAAEALANSSGIKKTLLGLLDNIAGGIKSFFSKIFSNGTVARAAGKASTEGAAEGVSKSFVTAVKNNIDDVVKNFGKLSAKSVAKAIPFISIIVDFINGMDDAYNTLGIISKPSIGERLLSGVIKALPSVIMTVSETIAVATLGAGAGATAIGIAAGVLASVIMEMDNIRYAFIDLISKVPCFSKLKEDREQAKADVAAFNAEHGTNLSIREYNNMMDHRGHLEKAGRGITNGTSAIFGYDSATKGDIKRSSEMNTQNKKAEKVRKKLATVFSSIWQFYGEKNFNYKLGSDLEGKALLNMNNSKFTNVSATIITNLVSMLDTMDKDTIADVYDNVTDFTGPIDSRTELKDTYKKGYNDPTSQFDIDEEHADWKRIKAIAGVCAIINKIFKPMGNKKDITAVVIDAMVPAYFTDKESEVFEWSENMVEDTSLYKLTMSDYDAPDIGSETGGDFIGPTMPVKTNANANNGLVPFGGNSKLTDMIFNGPIGRIGELIVAAINRSFEGIGNFGNVEDIFSSLANKNRQTNESIDRLRLLPTDNKYWNVEVDNENPVLSGLYKFVESMSRVVKAPFSLAAASLDQSFSMDSTASGGTATNTVVVRSGGSSSSGSTGGTSTTGSTKSSGNPLINGAKKVLTKIKSLFGKGKDDDPYHIYQRDYNGSYRTAGDTESQTIADSGCGPAAAASLLRMYGKTGDMHNAVNYAMNNKYKEVNGGTYPEYFSDYLGRNGITTNTNANNTDVINNLANGKPVILMGRDPSNSGASPYGSNYSHYVVARGLDANGNVVVEDSEDRNGSTVYSLADTLRNSSVRITTGNGKYGRGVYDKYISNVNKVISGSVASVINAVMNGGSVSVSSSSSGSSSNGGSPVGNASTNGTAGTLTVDTDVKTKCGYTAEQLKKAIKAVHPEGCSAEQFPEAAMNVEKSHGVNALFTIAVAIAEHGWNGKVGVNTTGGNWGNWNVFNIEGSPNSSNGRWKDYKDLTDAFSGFANLIMGEGYYKAGLTTPAKIGNRYCPPTAAENANYSPWGESVCQVAAIIEGKIAKTGTGRGKLNKLKSKASAITGRGRRYGRGIWGRDKLEDTDTTTTTSTANDTSSSSSDTSTTTSSASTSSSSSGGLASSFLGKLSDYVTKSFKGIYGNFYDAMYGNEATSNNDGGDSSGEYRGGDVIYAAAMVFEALYKADPTLKYDCNGGTYHDLVCRDGTVLEHERPDCSGMMSAVVHYMGYYTYRWSAEKAYTDSYHGEGFGTQNFESGSLVNNCILDKDGTPSKDWEIVKFDPNDTRPGDIRVKYGHTDMYIMDDANGNRYGVNAGSGDSGGSIGNGMYNSYCFGKYYLDNGKLPQPSELGGRGGPGAWTIQDNGGTIVVIRYKGSGNGKFGRGSSRNSKADFAKLNSLPPTREHNTDIRLNGASARKAVNGHTTGAYRNASVNTGRGRGPSLVSFDSIGTSSGNGRSYNGRGSTQTQTPMAIGRSGMGVSNYNNSPSIDLTQLINFVSAIANNSDKIDNIIQLLGVIAGNTNNNTNSGSGGLAALRNALNSGGSGVDIANAVYQIARS